MAVNLITRGPQGSLITRGSASGLITRGAQGDGVRRGSSSSLITRGADPPEWATFNGSTTVGNLDALAAAQTLHSLSGNYSYMVLVKGTAASELLGLLVSTGDISPSIRLRDSAGKCNFLHTNLAGGAVANENTTEDALDDEEHLIIWTTKDSGSNADLFSQVDGNATVSHGFGTDARQSDGEPWNTSGPGAVRVGHEFTGQMGYLGFARAQGGISNNANALGGTGGADIWAAYQSGGRGALHAAWVAANVVESTVVYSHVLDGRSAPVFGAATPIIWTDVTFQKPN